MPPKTPDPPADAGDVPPPGRPPDPHAVYAAVAELAAFIQPGAVACRIVIDVMNDDGTTGEATLAVPMGGSTAGGEVSDYDRAILDAIAKFKTGEWVPAKTLAAMTATETPNGYFRSRLRYLSGPGEMLEFHRSHGYRVRGK